MNMDETINTSEMGRRLLQSSETLVTEIKELRAENQILRNENQEFRLQYRELARRLTLLEEEDAEQCWKNLPPAAGLTKMELEKLLEKCLQPWIDRISKLLSQAAADHQLTQQNLEAQRRNRDLQIQQSEERNSAFEKYLKKYLQDEITRIFNKLKTLDDRMARNEVEGSELETLLRQSISQRENNWTLENVHAERFDRELLESLAKMQKSVGKPDPTN